MFKPTLSVSKTNGIDMKTNITLLIASTLILSACNTTIPKKDSSVNTSEISIPPTNTSRVVFYRNKRIYAMLRSCPVSINEQEAVDINNGSLITVDLKPGEHIFTHELWDIPGRYRIKAMLEGGKIYPIKLEPKSSVGTAGILGGYAGVLVNSAIEEQGGLCAIIPESRHNASENISKLGYQIQVTSKPNNTDKSMTSSSNTTETVQNETPSERLKTLKKLFADGLITQKDYEIKKKEILNNL